MSLGQYREKINEIDAQLLDLFQQRMDVVKKVALYKLDNDLDIFHPEREAEILAEKSCLARIEYKDFTKDLFSELMRLSKAYQQDIINKHNSI